VSPVTGNVMRVELRHASPLVGATKDASFNRATFDGSWYRRALSGILVTRFRAGAVLGTRLGLGAAAPTFIPLTERLYAGGPNSVRGFSPERDGPRDLRA
jgi:outer membrane protein insertion porin family/translocation and assembly module TamA